MTLKPYAGELGLFVMFVGVHVLDPSATSWREVLAVGLFLVGIALVKASFNDQQEKAE